jgi:hypothetical protein
MTTFTHPRLGEPVTAIGGSYCFTREKRLAFQGREVLYLVGWAAVDTACCGPAGCGYALVPGIISSWKTARSADGASISVVDPIRDPDDITAIRSRIEQAEGPIQVNFL